MPQPLIFQIRNDVVGRISHCGVLEFTAQDEAAFLPNWMMENLLLSDGATITLTLTSLPKLTFVKLQPLQYAFTTIPNPKAALEETLEKFTALTRGDTILTRYHHDDYLLQVTDVRPDDSTIDPAAGCVIDTTVEVAFDPPVEEAPKQEKIQVLQLDHPEQDHVLADHYKYYRVKLLDPTQGLRVALETRTPGSRPDLYVATGVDRRTAIANQWAGTTAAAVVVQPSDPGFSPTWYYVAVHSYAAPSAFILTATQIEPGPEQRSGGKSVANATDVVDPTAVRCQNCMRNVPQASYAVHEAVCARNNWACPVCRKVMSIRDRAMHAHCEQYEAVFAADDRSKHMALFHAPRVCKCGATFDAITLPIHQANDCPFRLQACKWCSDNFPFNQLQSHEQTCGSKTLPCVRCQRPVPRRLIDVHNATDHGVNPCVDLSGNRNTLESLQHREIAQHAEQIASTYGQPVNTDSELERAIAASLENNNDDDLAIAIAASLDPAEAELQNAIAASIEVDRETQRDIERAIAASLAEQHEDF